MTQSPDDPDGGTRPRRGGAFLKGLFTGFLIWDGFWSVAVPAVGGIVALVVAIFTLDGTLFAIALVAIPGAFVMGCLFKGLWDTRRE
jgi:hypothetical protein